MREEDIQGDGEWGLRQMKTKEEERSLPVCLFVSVGDYCLLREKCQPSHAAAIYCCVVEWKDDSSISIY